MSIRTAMVAIAPFRAIRYNPARIGDLAAVVCPPYDVISPQLQDQLYERSPHNFVRVIFGKQSPADTPTDNRYTRAKRTFDAWLAEGVLVRDAAPAVYLYEHQFMWQGESLTRLGVTALLDFDRTDPNAVLPHESTFGEPKADRTKLLEAVNAVLEPIFFIAPDPDGSLRDLLQRLSEAAPLMSARVGQEQVRVWAVTEARAIAQLQETLASSSVLIADGHHRYAVAYANRARFGPAMGCVVTMQDPAVRVRPIHRVAHLTADQQRLWEAHLAQVCELRPAVSAERLMEQLASAAGEGHFGYYAKGRFAHAIVKPEPLANWLMRPSVPLALAGLDVAILHHVLVPQGLAQPSTGANAVFAYTPDAGEAVAMVDRQEGSCAWLLRELSLERVYALALQGLTLPQKSTYFYPKLLSGLFIHPCYS